MFNTISFLVIFFTFSLSAYELAATMLSKRPLSLSSLAYSYKVMESFVDEKTMNIHRTKHPQGYVTNLLIQEEIIKNISHYNIARPQK